MELNYGVGRRTKFLDVDDDAGRHLKVIKCVTYTKETGEGQKYRLCRQNNIQQSVD
jgi:hypothetical protein